jgi:hypothetical protein
VIAPIWRTIERAYAVSFERRRGEARAHRGGLFTEMGATGQAERLAQALAG